MSPSSDQNNDRQMVDDTERWLQRRGVPVAERHITSPLALFGRVIPLLVIVLFAESITLLARGVYRGWTLYGVFVLSLVGLVWLVVLAWNRRPRRTWHVPAWLAGLAILGFVFGPAALGLTFEDSDALVVNLLAINVAVLVAAVLSEYFNITPVVRHEINEIRTGHRQMLAPMRQVLPIMLLSVLFLFTTAEIWQVSHDATSLGFGIVVVALIGLSAALVASRARDALEGVWNFTSWQEIDHIAESTTAPDLPLPDDLPEPPDLEGDGIGRRQVRILLFVTMTVQLLVVASVVTVVLAIVGMLLVRRETIEQWTELQDADWDPQVAVTILGHEYPLTSETILMSILLGVFAAMQFAASIMTNAELQKSYFAGIYDDAREVIAVRARFRRYAAVHDISSPAITDSPSPTE